MRKLSLLLSAVILTQLTACAVQGYQNPPPPRYPATYQTPYPTQYPQQPVYQQPTYPQPVVQQPAYQQPAYVEAAVIINMRDVSQPDNQVGAGAVMGAVIGGVLGHQIGKGDGRDLATIGGAVAGGIVGNEIERSNSQRVKTEMTIRLQNGEIRSLLIEPGSPYRIGDRVNVSRQNGQVVIVR